MHFILYKGYIKKYTIIKMGWFNKVEKRGNQTDTDLKLPELPRLPELPTMRDSEVYSERSIHQLPSFPSSSLGNKFSQNNIKEAITGRKEDEEVYDADEFAPNKEMQRMLKPLTKELQKMPKEFEDATSRIKSTEPVFIRIDKFEESLRIFEKTKEQISEIEKMLREIKQEKEKEDEELISWENEIQSLKKQIEKVDKDVFSKVE